MITTGDLLVSSEDLLGDQTFIITIPEAKYISRVPKRSRNLFATKKKRVLNALGRNRIQAVRKLVREHRASKRLRILKV